VRRAWGGGATGVQGSEKNGLAAKPFCAKCIAAIHFYSSRIANIEQGMSNNLFAANNVIKNHSRCIDSFSKTWHLQRAADA